MQVDRVRNAVLFCLVTCAWIAAIALDVDERATQPRSRAYGEGTCGIPDEAASEAVRLLFCTGRMPVNCAERGELELLDGVGLARARAIAEYRETHGPFERPEDLEAVRTIGPVTAARLAEQISFEKRGTSCASRRP
ncbi:MAG: helix-hairpin-helix domain-containing protein [Deltaproteobacteria bacterium]|nr:helix-hairpin-helix domain-containing protein [Deltaproteobacteria bacterium]